MALMMTSYVFVAAFFAAIGLLAGIQYATRRARKGGKDTTPNSETRELVQRIQRIASGMAADLYAHKDAVADVDVRLKSLNVEEDGTEAVVAIVAELLEHNSNIQQRLAAAETRLDELSREVDSQRQEARTDALTGCANRRAFDEAYAEQFDRFLTHGSIFSLVMLDIDHFKQVNDTYGHSVGDEVLRTIGRVLRNHVRGTDLVARYGGEEFAIIMPGMSVQQACFAAEALRIAIAAQIISYPEGALKVTASMGVAQPSDSDSLEGSHQRADDALYAAKKSGRNAVFWHDGHHCHPITDEAPRVQPEPSDADGYPILPDGTSDDDARSVAVTVVSDKFDSDRFDRDILQNLPTKTEFCQDVRHRVAEWNRGGHGVTVALCDLANETELENEYGSEAVTSIVVAVANVVAQSIRDMDRLARYTPTTLAIMMPRAREKDAAFISERIRKAVNETQIRLFGKRVPVELAFAVAEVTDGDDMQGLISRAANRLDSARGDTNISTASA